MDPRIFTNTASKAPSKRALLLMPKDHGLANKDKPFVLIIRMAHDEIGRKDNATAYKPTIVMAESRGYTVVNTKEIIFREEDGALCEKIKGNLKKVNETSILSPFFLKQDKPLVIWLEAHGAPSWLFGDKDNFLSEAKGTLLFRDCLQRIAENNGIVISDILMSACYSGTEIYHAKTNEYTNSPARMLSLLMPEQQILGFIGVTSGAKVRGFVNEKHEPEIMSLHDASIVFKAGCAIEYKEQDLFCEPGFIHMKPFVMESCSLQEKEYYRICAAREYIAQHNKNAKLPTCFGTTQYNQFAKKAVEIAKNEHQPATEQKR